MRPPSKTLLQRLGSLLLVWLMLLACKLVAVSTTTPANVPNQPTAAATQASSQAVPTAAATLASGQAVPTAGAATPATDPLDRLLTMRSIKFNLTSLKWDGTSYSIDVEIDSTGNMHVKHSLPGIDPALFPKGYDPNTLPSGYELYVVGGKAYRPSDQNPGWMTTSIDENYIQTLARELHGPDGPAIWLDLLPLGSIHAAGKDTVGGFAADKYTVNGQVEGQSITGAIWFEPQADALVQAELHVPAVLLSDPSKPQQGELKITLNAQKANVPPVSLPDAPAGQVGGTATPIAGNAPTGSGTLAVSDSYPYFPKIIAAFSLAASPGKIWIGTGYGTIQEVDPQSGAFGQSISLAGTGASTTNTYPIMKLGFDGQTIWALGGFSGNGSDKLFAIDPGSGIVAHQWDLTQWNLDHDEDNRGTASDFGFSPGKIWVKNQIVDTLTFEVKHVGFVGAPHFAYDGKGWMWMTGVGPEACDGLDFINTDNPSQDRYQCRYPFLNHAEEGYSNVGNDSPLVLAGDRVWIGGGWVGNKPTYTLEAYTADTDQLVKETKPLVSVPLMDNYRNVRLLFAGNYLWVVLTGGEKAGFLFQLDPKTGAIINSLDLVGDQGRSKGDIPVVITTEGDNLWLLTRRQVLRIQLP